MDDTSHLPRDVRDFIAEAFSRASPEELASFKSSSRVSEPDLILNVFRGCDTKIISTIGDKLHKVIFKEIIPLLLRNPHILKKSFEAFTKISDEEKIVL